MRRRFYLAYPALLAVIPILYRQVRNPWPALEDAVAFSAALGVAIVAVQLVCYGVLRVLAVRRGAAAAAWAGGVAVAAVGAFYYAPALSDGTYEFLRARPFGARVVLACGLAIIAVAAWWVMRRGGARVLGRALPPTGRFVGLTALLLVSWFGVQIAASRVRTAWILHHNSLVQELARPIPVTRTAVAGPKRDVYVLLLDSYPGAEGLRDYYNVNNAPFLDSLRALGFHLPAQVRSNYPITLLSVSSFLNFTQLDSLTTDLPANYHDLALGGYLFEHNRAAQFLKSQGYRFVFFPSAWFPPTRHNPEADVEFQQPPGFDLGRAIDRSLLVDSFTSETLLRRLMRHFPTRQAELTAEAERTFAGVAALAARPNGGPPVYAMAHLLVPHPPFLADSACRPYPRGTELLYQRPPERPDVRAAIAGFIGCVNTHTLATVRAILARPGPRPVIVLQGDHGMDALDMFDTAAVSMQRVTPPQVRERFSPFGAYYLPDGGAAALGDTVSMVNVLRAVFRHYHGADLPPVPNAMYAVDLATWYHLTPVDTLSLRIITRPAPRRR